MASAVRALDRFGGGRRAAPFWGSPHAAVHLEHHRSKRSLACRSKSQASIGGYTPADYITYSEEPEHQCHHVVEVLVDAPVDVCFALWNDWHRLIDFLDLIGQVGASGAVSGGGGGGSRRIAQHGPPCMQRAAGSPA